MTPMLEKAAMAAYEAYVLAGGCDDVPWEKLTDEQVSKAFRQARAVLLAVREPDEGAVESGWEAMAGDNYSWSWSKDERPQTHAFTAMIDAILKESE